MIEGRSQGHGQPINAVISVGQASVVASRLLLPHSSAVINTLWQTLAALVDRVLFRNRLSPEELLLLGSKSLLDGFVFDESDFLLGMLREGGA